MTDDHMNGVNPADAAKAQRQAEDLHLQSFIGPAYIGAINGCVRSLPGFAIERVVLMIAACFGKTLGECLSIGHLAPLLHLRKQCIDTIERAMRDVKIEPPPAASPKPMSSVPADTQELLKKLKVQ